VKWSFQRLVWSLFAGIAGESFYRPGVEPSQRESWSTIVNDLISDTAHRALRRNNAHIVRDQPGLLRGSEALRALNANLYSDPAMLVRASLGDALSAFSDNVGEVGLKLEGQREESLRKPFAAPVHKDQWRGEGDGGEPPILGRAVEGRDEDGGGMSFIIANWQKL
jgi:hypothetical protein